MMTIALIAHDKKKEEMVAFAKSFKSQLKPCTIISTENTGRVLESNLGLKVQKVLSGPLGGDQEVGAKVARGEVQGVVFLRDPLTAQPHEPDISALLRVCDVHGVPLATNLASACLLLSGLLGKGE